MKLSMRFSTKSQKIVSADKATVWEWITGESFVADYFPEMSRVGSPLTEYVKATHKAGSRIRPSWAVAGELLAWDANAGVTVVLPDTGIEVQSVLISLEERGPETAITLEVEADTDFGPGYWASRKMVKAFVTGKLDELNQVAEAPGDWALPVAA